MNVWGYQASTNPSVPNELYFGDATTLRLMLYPTRSALKQVTGFAPCPLGANKDKARVVNYHPVLLGGS